MAQFSASYVLIFPICKTQVLHYYTFYGYTINDEDRKIILTKKKCWNLLNFVTFKEFQEKSAFLKIVAQAFEARGFLNIF